MWERGRGRDGCVGVAEMCTTSARVSAVMQLSDNFSFFVRLSAVTRRYGDFPVVLSTIMKQYGMSSGSGVAVGCSSGSGV